MASGTDQPQNQPDLPSTRPVSKPELGTATRYELGQERSEQFFGPATTPGELGTLGRYRILKRIGKGGMGAVYLGFDDRLKRRVAIKTMLPQYANDSRYRGRFLREVRVTAQLDHENIVRLYEADEIEGLLFLAMEYLQGCPLDEYLRLDNKPTLKQILRVGRELATGLGAAHHKSLIHRDIKPSNVWLESPNGRVKILDFGLAKVDDGDSSGSDLTRSGAVVGTPSYMSPEQARGYHVDHRSDLFSLGTLLYRLTTGELPFQGTNTTGILLAITMDEPVPVRSINPEIPPPLAELIHRLLAKSPDDRPDSADIVVEMFRSLERNPNQQVVATTEPTYVAIPVAAETESEFAHLDSGEVTPRPSTTVAEKRGSRKLGLWLGALAAILGSVSLVAYLIFGGSRTPPVAVEPKPRVEPKPVPKIEKPTTKPVANSPFPPLSSEFLALFGKLTPAEQVRRVAEDLKKRNPDFEVNAVEFTPYPNEAMVRTLTIRSAAIADLTPVQALTSLESLDVGPVGAGIHSSILIDLSPLSEMTHLDVLMLMSHRKLKDLAPLKKLKLRTLAIAQSSVSDLSPLKGMPLESLYCYLTDVTDLSPLKGMPLKNLTFGGTFRPQVRDLSALKGLPLVNLTAHMNEVQDLSPLEGAPIRHLEWNYSPLPDPTPLMKSPIETLILDEPARHREFIEKKQVAYLSQGLGRGNSIPKVADYWKGHEAKLKKQEAFVRATQLLPLQQQIEAVRAELNRPLNPGATPVVLEATIENDRVTGLVLRNTVLGHDLSSLRVFAHLKTLELQKFDNYVLLAPLADLPIEEFRFGSPTIIWLNRPAIRSMKGLRSIDGQPAGNVLDAMEKVNR